ncbi:hypothetical protein RJ639_037753 [Escallonia herrerae]|uniref:Integrase catalytic domain-containing protein n=1 Tax=Escallonia herrerae TaxID=1293975 RepID=A0AA88WXE2_9ASTE|nr:hypothetical protein RJ639_037753 [Escallonia herrerae]
MKIATTRLNPPETLTLTLVATEQSATPTPQSSSDGRSWKKLISSQFPPTSRCLHRKNSSALFRIVQGPKESLKSYYARFNSEKLLIDHLDPEKWKKESAESKGDAPERPPVINTIFGGPSAGGLSSSSPKAYAQQVNLTQGPAKRTKASTSLEFDDANLDGISLPHDDALVITLRIDVFQVKRILVDTESSADIIFEDAFNQMGISDDRVKPISSPLYGFTGVGFVKGDQILARRCYVASCRAEETLSINDRRDEKALRCTEPVEALISILLIEGDNERQALKNIKNFEWTAECQTSFDALKEYLASPPLLSKPIMGEDLFLYLAVTESAVSAVLVREQDGQQLPVYYVSKVLQGAEQRYPNAEKLEFALLTALGEFDICYRPQPSIKGQALADFIVECTLPIEVEEPLLEVEGPFLPVQSGLFTWMLFVDGSSNASRSEAGLILNGPDGLTVEQSPSPLSSLSSPIPFAMWGMDIMGPFPPATAQRRFVIVAIDYFTKWVKAEALATISEKKCEDFFWRTVVCRFGIPRVLVTDNGKQFDNPTFKTFCANLTIEQRFTSVAHPQTNGQTEVTNRTLLQRIKKKLDGAKGLWVDELPKILWAYNTTKRTSTGETPFNLSFGTEALIPVEVGLPSLG